MTTARKQPQDRKPKQEKSEAVETTGKFRISTDYELREVEGWQVEVEGIDIFLPKESLTDNRSSRIMAKAQAGDKRAAAQYGLVIERMLGEEQYDKVQDALEDPATGRVSDEQVGGFLASLMKAINPNG